MTTYKFFHIQNSALNLNNSIWRSKFPAIISTDNPGNKRFLDAEEERRRSTPSPGRFTPTKSPALFVQKAGLFSEPVWKDAENLPPPGFDPRSV